MTVSTSRLVSQAMPLAQRLIAVALVALACGLPARLCGAEFPVPVTAENEGFLLTEGTPATNTGRALGAQFRIQNQVGEYVGRQSDGLTSFELMPYGFLGTGMIFGDARGSRSYDDHWGANLGLGYRQYITAWDRILGGYFYYDQDEFAGPTFRQISAGVETYGAWWDARSNFYLPIGERSELIETEVVTGSQRFAGNAILFDLRREFGQALKGVDMELGVPLPGKFSDVHEIKFYAGWYHFQGRDGEPSLWGYRGRLQGNITPCLNTYLELNHDRVFDTTFLWSLSWSFGGYRQANDEPRTQFSRMTTPVQRNYNIVVARVDVIEDDIIAINAATGLPFRVIHVESYDDDPSLANAGTFENPFETIEQALSNILQPAPNQPPTDIVFVHAASTFGPPPADQPASQIDLSNPGLTGLRLLGEGTDVTHFIDVVGVGPLALPRATPFNARPDIDFQNVPGDAVILGPNTEFSGFVTRNANGNGIVAVGLANATVRSVDVIDAGGDGIRLENNVGRIQITDSNILIGDPTNTNGVAFHVLGGSAQVTFSGNGTSTGFIENNSNYAVLVENTQGGFVNMTGSTILDTDGQGIGILNATGDITIDDATLTRSAAVNPAIEVTGGDGIVTFRGDVEIVDPVNDAIHLHDLGVNRTVNFADVLITGRSAHGVNIENVAGEANFFTNLTINTVTAGTDPGIEVQNSSGQILFQNVAIDGSGGTGITIGNALTNNTGTISVLGTTTLANTAGAGIFIEDDDATIQFNGVNIFSRVVEGIRIEDTRGPVTFNGQNTIDNPLASQSPAIRLLGNSAPILFEDVGITAATGPLNQGAGVDIRSNPGLTSFNDLGIIATNGTGLFARDSGRISINFGTVDVTLQPAVDIENTTTDITFGSVSSLGSVTQGIRLVNTQDPNQADSFFAVAGGGTPGSGGTIQGAVLDGVLANNAGSVTLQFMNLTQNQRGVNAIDLLSLELEGMQVTANNLEGVLATDVIRMQITDSIFSVNGSTVLGPDTISATMTQLANYDYTFINNQIISAPVAGLTNDAVEITALGAAAGSDLNLVFNANTITTTNAFSDPVIVNWNGSTLAVFDENVLNFTGNNVVGIIFNNNSTDPLLLTDLTVTDNTITGGGTFGTGFQYRAFGPADLEVSRNTMTFAGTGTGLDFFTIAANSTVLIETNEITDTVDGGTGILFRSVTAPATITINNNLITLQDNPGFIERGIVFQTVGGVITLNGTVNNIVDIIGQDGAEVFFFIPAGTSNGQIIVNGAPVP